MICRLLGNIIKRKIYGMAKIKKRKANQNKVDDAEFSTSSKIPKIPTNKLNSLFYNKHSETLARALLGKILVRKLNCGTVIKGRIVETECYLGTDDKASITCNGRRTKTNEPLYMKAGTTFVYLTYGMYHCINISSEDSGGAVLLRAVEPLDGIDKMQIHRQAKNRKTLQEHELCNGPSKLCLSFNITKAELNQIDLAENEFLWIENENTNQDETCKIIATSRIGVDRAGKEWANKPFRFYIFDNTSVSKRDKNAEQVFTTNE